MLSVEEALEKVLGCVHVLEVEEKPLLECLGQVLAEDVYSRIDIPPRDNTAMDGYAVRAKDTRGASTKSPRFLRIIDTVPAGYISPKRVETGTAIRIMTGAPIPEGADSIVRFEDTDEDQRQGRFSEIGIVKEIEPGADIRCRGEDITKGSIVLSKGTLIRPSEAGVLASLGRSQARVIRRPKVAVLATGDELVDIGQPLQPGKIYNSNTYSVAALVKRYGGISKILGIARDNKSSLLSKLRQGLDSDLFITTGGVSMGDYDMIKDILAAEGEIAFWTVRMKPGKPLAFGILKVTDEKGKVKHIPQLGLPGNPVSSMVTFELFARPSILKMMGKKNLDKPTIEAITQDRVVNTDGRRVFARARIEKRGNEYFARLTGPQGSGILTSMASANGLVIVPEDKPAAEVGEKVQVLVLDWNEEQQE